MCVYIAFRVSCLMPFNEDARPSHFTTRTLTYSFFLLHFSASFSAFVLSYVEFVSIYTYAFKKKVEPFASYSLSFYLSFALSIPVPLLSSNFGAKIASQFV